MGRKPPGDCQIQPVHVLGQGRCLTLLIQPITMLKFFRKIRRHLEPAIGAGDDSSRNSAFKNMKNEN